ncbi:MAG TPA: C40 family peptidase [Casimicrobiaceae bacterium]|nr:C40 family peptidase [Casimicrobiaceae bacterium]
MTAQAIPRTRSARARILAASFASATLFAPLAAADPPSTPERAFQVAPVSASVWHSAQDLAIYALGLIGVDYRFGGTTPERGLDCSGLVRYVFQQVTGVMLPRTSQEISRLGEKIPVAELMPGDLVFFNTRRLQFSHVGIYLGEDRFIHAPRQGGEVEIVTLSKGYWQKRFDGARRLVGVLPRLMIPSAHAETASIDAPPPDAGVFPATPPSPEEVLP